MDVDEKEKVKAGSAAAAAEDDKKAVDAKDDDSDSEDEEPPPRREMPQAQTFGDDPSTFPDPTVYEIREVQPGMTEDEIRDIYSVATYPPSDLADLIAGDPPDKDFTAGKVTNQIAFFPTFSTYLEPYFRPYGEEDLAFLRERGDRTAPFVFPKRGKKHYTEVWAEEDGAMALDSPSRGDGLPPNQPRGTIENMDDDVAETDKLSIGPLVSRLLQAMRPESRIQVPAPAEDAKPAPASNGGDIVMGDAGDANDAAAAAQHPPAPPPPDSAPAAACFMPESSTEAWKKATHPKLDYHQVDERVKQELRYIGFLPLDNFDADYDGHFDDEVSARLRLLQGKLRDQILINGARKARLTDLVRERMAHQEYQTILEDLDTQVQGAYLKRTRTMGKSKKAKRPGGAGGGANAGGAAGAAGAGANAAGAGVARQGIGDMTKTLMERRRRWIDTIGKSVFDDPNLGRVPRSEDPDSSIFAPEVMVDLMKKEQEAWDEEVEEDDDG
jgi:transcriptional adapter 3